MAEQENGLHWAGPMLHLQNRINDAMGLNAAAVEMHRQAFLMATRRSAEGPNLGDDLTIMGLSHGWRILSVLAVELALKDLYAHTQLRNPKRTHNLSILYGYLPQDMQQQLEAEYKMTTIKLQFGPNIRPSHDEIVADVELKELLDEFANHFERERYSTEENNRQLGSSSANEDRLFLVVRAAWKICVRNGWDKIAWSKTYQ